ncbi:FAD-dependent oxidoreductase [Paractinoplanes globisporus]|uniref:FAD-dependent oxidoreductase n=1 Tax=Paractinoplanes globisporus TaxID=113565 RepID=A0ABW6WDT5_9ACTN|nr:FAD-dependent oxidoreductase [Actinoplanes globisporus]
MPRTDTLIIGAGHAGLAMSRCLADRGLDHVVLERGSVGERWRTARWDSFRLLTPNWLTRLPGSAYDGPDPDGFMTAGEFAGSLSRYARSSGAPVRPHTTVTRLESAPGGFRVRTDRGEWAARAVVIATGYHSRAVVPALAARLAPGISQLTPARYRSPSALPDGGALVVGASASGVQIAHELALAGRKVVLAVGGHTRLPRRYRGRDILWWLDRIGALDRDIDDVPDAAAARAEPSLQLTGASGAREADLGVLRAAGVVLAGRLCALDGPVAGFAGDLAETMGAAHHRMTRVLRDIDRYVAETPGVAAGPPDPPPGIPVPKTPSEMDLRRAGIATVVWATGFRPSYPWLAPAVLDHGGRLRHRRGVTAVPGLYAIGLRFQSRRNSTFIDGARHDAAYLAGLITSPRALCSAG